MKQTDRPLFRIGAVLFWILLWWGGALLANRSLLLPLPTPVGVAVSLWHLAATAAFRRSVAMSLIRIGLGFAAAVAAGGVLAVLCAFVPLLNTLLSPFKRVTRAVPVAGMTVVIFLWVPRALVPGFISFITVLPLIWDNLEQGLAADNASLKEMGRVMGLSERRIFTEITLPGLRPYATAALAGGLGFAFKSGIAAEIICRTGRSLGDLLWQGKTTLDYERVFAVMLVIVALSLLAEQLVKAVTQKEVKR